MFMQNYIFKHYMHLQKRLSSKHFMILVFLCTPWNHLVFWYFRGYRKRPVVWNWLKNLLTLPARCISESSIKIKLNLNCYFHTSLWCLKRFYEDLKGLHKTFWGTSKKYENKNFSQFFSLSEIGARAFNINHYINFYYVTWVC